MKLPVLSSVVVCGLLHVGDAFTPASRPFVVGTSTKLSSSTLEAPSTTSSDGNNEMLMPDETVDTPLMMDVEADMAVRSPAEIENDKFVCDENVELWRNFQINGLESAEQNIQNMVEITRRLTQTREGADYWLRHTGRTSYFVMNALLGNFGFRLHEMLVNGNDAKESPFNGILQDPAIASRLFLEAALAYEQDYKSIQQGLYKKPYDMYQSTRQASPLYFGRQTSRFVREAIGTIGRRTRGREEDKRIWISDKATPSLYPDYYRTAFHYQTDGWMSQESADVYETSTETLFLGRQDAMQRTALPTLVSYSKELAASSTKPMKVLEVACGTGRFMTFVRDNLPLNTEYTASDLSPFYLNAARDNDSNWRKVRAGVEGNTKASGLKPARLVQAKAEDLPFDDEEFDAVVCVYLYHEIPREIRAQAAAEMARVVKPGGRVVLTDSVQLGDRPIFDPQMANFGNFNEPFYADYVADELPLHFEKAGLECLTKTVCASTKSLAFRKPE